MGSTTHLVNAGETTRLAIVVSKTSSINALSLAELRRMYLGDAVDANGKPMIPLNHGPSTKERAGFDRVVLNMSGDTVSRYWIDRKIRGQSGAPKNIDPADVHQRVVSKLDGAVGYVPLKEVREDVKVIRIDGKAPTDRDYPIVF